MSLGSTPHCVVSEGHLGQVLEGGRLLRLGFLTVKSERNFEGSAGKMVRVEGFSDLVALMVIVIVGGFGFDVVVAQDGSWQTLLANSGIATMHTAVTRYDTAVMLDRTNTGASQLLLAGGRCRDQPLERMLKHDCYAHSVAFDPLTNTVRPLVILTDTWCSSGQFLSDGTLWQTGGDFEGAKKIRTLTPCASGAACDWVESNDTALTAPRWYSSNHILPDGQRMIVVGGRATPSYEFVPKRTPTEGKFDLPLLYPGGDNLYPYVALLPDGTLWIFAAVDSILLNYNTGAVLRKYPTLPGKTRNYPAAGSMTLLPLSYETKFQSTEVLVCGGASGGYNTGANLPAQKSCGRMTVTDPGAAWAMEDMPVERTMGDMSLLPTGDVLIVNGAQVGSQGWGAASQPALQPCLYATNGNAGGQRFRLLAGTTIARMYHSTANLLADGRVLVAGSNTHQFYTYKDTPFPTEFRVEAFSPPYLSLDYIDQRPLVTAWPNKMKYGRDHFVSFLVAGGFADRGSGRDGEGQRNNGGNVVECNLNSAPFVTHSYAQGQRQLKLQTLLFGGRNRRKSNFRTILVTAPPDSNVAPSQYYMMFVVLNGIPGKAKWVQITA